MIIILNIEIKKPKRPKKLNPVNYFFKVKGNATTNTTIET